MKAKHLILTAAMATVGIASAENCAVRNGTFEKIDPTTGRVAEWAYDEEFFSVDNSGGRNGTRALLFDNTGKKGSSGSTLQQRVRVYPGTRFKFGCWVKTENLTGEGFCARICIQWEDRYGRFIDGCYQTAHINGTKDWVKTCGATQAAPAKAMWATIRPEVVGPAKGKAWFDDVWYEPLHTTHISGMYNSAYRGEVASGTVKFVVGFNVLDGGGTGAREGADYRFTYADSDGVERTVAAAEKSLDQASVTLKATDLKMGKSAVRFELIARNGKSLGKASSPITRVATERRRRVRFDSLGRTIVDGKPFFPLGMYWSVSKPYHKFQLPKINAETIKTFRKGPFNVVMPYEAQSKANMDLLHENGIMLVYAINGQFNGRDWDPSGKDPARLYPPNVKRIIDANRDHPALLAWYLNDERGIDELENLTGRQRAVELLDPDHPTWSVLYQFEQVRDYMPTFDCIGTDPYPIPGDIGKAYLWASTTRSQTMGMRPMWQVPQAFDWGTFRKGKAVDSCRMPTREEMRNMTWQNVAGGANGLVYYSYTYLMQSPHAAFEPSFADVCAVAEEVKSCIPILLSGTKPPSFSSTNPFVPGRVYRDGDRLYVLAVNTRTDRQETTVRLPLAFRFARTVFGPKPNCSARSLDFALPAIGQSLVELKLSEL